MRFIILVLFSISLFAEYTPRFLKVGDYVDIPNYGVYKLSEQVRCLTSSETSSSTPISPGTYYSITGAIVYTSVSCNYPDYTDASCYHSGAGAYTYVLDQCEYNVVPVSCEDLSNDNWHVSGAPQDQCTVENLNALLSPDVNLIVSKAFFSSSCGGVCYYQSYSCEDGAPPFVDSNGSRTCDRSCDSVGYVTSYDENGSVICVEIPNDSNSTNNDSNSSSSDSNSTSNDSNATNPNDDDLNTCGTMTINLVQNASLIDSYTLSGSVSDPFPKISHCSHFSLWNTSNLQHSFRANECSGYCILGYDFNSSGSVTGKNGENNITIDVSSLIQAIKNNSNTISGKIDETNSKLDGIVSSIDGVASSLAGANDKLDSIQQAINGSSNFIVAAINDVGSKIDTSNSHLASIDSKLDVTNSHLKDIKDVLTGDDINPDEGGLLNSIDSFAEDVNDKLNQIQTEYDNLKSFIEGNPVQFSEPSGCSPVFSMNFHGKEISFDLCSGFSYFRPIIYFFIYLALTLLSIVITFRGLKILVRI